MPAFHYIADLKAATSRDCPEWLPEGQDMSDDAESHHSDGTWESRQVQSHFNQQQKSSIVSLRHTGRAAQALRISMHL